MAAWSKPTKSKDVCHVPGTRDKVANRQMTATAAGQQRPAEVAAEVEATATASAAAAAGTVAGAGVRAVGSCKLQCV